MFSVQKLLGKEDRFFGLLEESALEARASVQSLVKYLKHPDQLKTLDEFIANRRKDKAIATRISDALCTTFVTALEREDIEALSVAIYKIPKTVEKIAERVMIAPELLKGIEVTRECALLEKAVETLLVMIQELRRGIHLERIKRHNDQMQAIEGEADKVLVEMLGQLYAKHPDTVRVVFLKDLFEMMEKVVDRCRDAGNVINHIVLKNT
jgi:uncharacterized protein Yka (UPF0111/DUF47 family)